MTETTFIQALEKIKGLRFEKIGDHIRVFIDPKSTGHDCASTKSSNILKIATEHQMKYIGEPDHLDFKEKKSS